MNKTFLTLLLSLTISFAIAQTQLEINQTAFEKSKKADKELNSVYQKILKEYAQDTAFIKNLKISQRIWVKFRDAEMKVKYPDRPIGEYGSIQPMCASEYLTGLINERIKKLNEWITGAAEGDPCSGSVN